MHISVANVEELAAAARQLQEFCDSADRTAQDELEALQEQSDLLTQEHARAQEYHHACIDAMAQAQQRLSDARTALSYARTHVDSQGKVDDSEVAAAEAEVAAAEKEVAEAENALEQASYALDELSLMSERLNCHIQQRQSTLREGLARFRDMAQDTAARLLNQHEALMEYLGGAPADDFLQWKPESGSKITIAELGSRLSPPPEVQRDYIRHLGETDKAFREQAERLAARVGAARTDMEMAAAMRACSIHLTGSYAEHLAQDALAPLFERVDTQRRTYMEDGRYTKTDLVAEGARVPIVLGRGERLYVPAGGSLGVEVKSGKPAYLLAQAAGHLQFQARGHEACHAGLTLCTRDLHDLSEEKRRELRHRIRESGSPMLAGLPHKRELDSLCWEYICQRADQLNDKP